MDQWSATFQALLGTSDGEYRDYFVFLLDAGVPEIHQALLELGADPDRPGADELPGTPVTITIQWTAQGKLHTLPYEAFFPQKHQPKSAQPIIAPWQPRFVFHGTGFKNKAATGCVACPLYCPGGIIGNLSKTVPTLRVDWEKVPPPGTKNSAIIKPQL